MNGPIPSYLPDASATVPGKVATTAQIYAGLKTFNDGIRSVADARFDGINTYRSAAGNCFPMQAYPGSGSGANWIIDLANNSDIANSATLWLGTIGTAGWVTTAFTGNIIGSSQRGSGVTRDLHLFAKNYTTGYTAADMSLTLQANTGRVGIGTGTTGPTEKFDVVGGAIVSRGPFAAPVAGQSGAYLSYEATGGLLMAITLGTSFENLKISAKDVIFTTGTAVDTERLRIKSDGAHLFSAGVADGAGAVAYKFNNTVTLSTAGAKLLSVLNNSTEVLSITRDATYGDDILTIPTPASTVPSMKIGTKFLSCYGGAFQFGSSPAGSDGVLALSSATLGGYTQISNRGLSGGLVYPIGLSQTGAYGGGASNGIAIFSDGSAGGALGRGIMCGVSDAAPNADFPVFATGFHFSIDTGYAEAVTPTTPTFLTKVLGDGRIGVRGTDGSGTGGAQTINRACGKGKIANGATTCVITNSLVTANTLIKITWNGDHGAARWWVTSAAGSFTVNLSAAAGSATVFSFELTEII